MIRIAKSSQYLNKIVLSKASSTRCYSLCKPPPGQCNCQSDSLVRGPRISPPQDCRPGPIPPNPCVPRFHQGKDTWKKYRFITFFICFPLIIVQALRSLGHESPHKGECRDYEYMRLRSKRFPWGEGVETLFHNPHVNHLPGECTLPPLDCD